MTDARDKLRAASNLIEGVRGFFISAGYIQSARFLQNALNLLSDQVGGTSRFVRQTTLTHKPRAQNRRLRPGAGIEKQLFHVQLFREAGSREGKAGCPLGGP